MTVSRETQASLPLLEVQGLRAGYGRKLLLDIDALQIHPHTVTAILGPNGSGKSTLLRCLIGELLPRAGSITVAGKALRDLSAREVARHIAYVPQESGHAFAFTVRELVQMGANLSRTDQKASLEPILGSLDLAALAERNLNALSGGERQRASIARALAQDTPCLLLDEPTAHLDLRHQALLRTILQNEAARGKGVGIVLHDLNFAASFADRIILLSKGKIAAQGTPDEVLEPTSLQPIYGTGIRLLTDKERGTRWIEPVSRVP